MYAQFLRISLCLALVCAGGLGTAQAKGKRRGSVKTGGLKGKPPAALPAKAGNAMAPSPKGSQTSAPSGPSSVSFAVPSPAGKSKRTLGRRPKGSHKSAKASGKATVYPKDQRRLSNKQKQHRRMRTTNKKVFASEGEARTFARRKLGRKPVRVGPNKLRSANGKWQMRQSKKKLYINLEELNPKSGQVLANHHLYWKKPRGK